VAIEDTVRLPGSVLTQSVGRENSTLAPIVKPWDVNEALGELHHRGLRKDVASVS